VDGNVGGIAVHIGVLVPKEAQRRSDRFELERRAELVESRRR
jgi:hypothetical protein